MAEGDVFGVASEDVEGQASEGGEVGGAVVPSVTGLIFGHQHVELPVEVVLDGPVSAALPPDVGRGDALGEGIVPDVVSGLAFDSAQALDAGERLEVDERLPAGGLGEADDDGAAHFMAAMGLTLGLADRRAGAGLGLVE